MNYGRFKIFNVSPMSHLDQNEKVKYKIIFG